MAQSLGEKKVTAFGYQVNLFLAREISELLLPQIGKIAGELVIKNLNEQEVTERVEVMARAIASGASVLFKTLDHCCACSQREVQTDSAVINPQNEPSASELQPENRPHCENRSHGGGVNTQKPTE